MQYGLIQDWDAMEKVWHHGFKNFLGAGFSPADHPVLISELPLAPKSHREKLTQAMFEGFEVPGMFVANQGVLALYASGRITGVVLDVGHAVSKFVPIQEGFCLTHAVERTNWAGQNVTLFLRELLRSDMTGITPDQDPLTFANVQKIKDDLSMVDSNYSKTLDVLQKQKTLAEASKDQENTEQSTKKKQSNAVEYFKNYTLPDGKIIQIGQIERIQANEILFNPQVVASKKILPRQVRPSYHNQKITNELDELGLQVLLADSIGKCEIDIKKELAGNLIVCGGATEATGFQKRIQIEMEQLMPTMYPINIAPVGSAQNSKQIAVWSGGAILAQLSSFSSMWIKKSEYNEYGPQIVQRRTY
jgi:actin-related protein